MGVSYGHQADFNPTPGIKYIDKKYVSNIFHAFIHPGSYIQYVYVVDEVKVKFLAFIVSALDARKLPTPCSAH